MDSLVSFRTLEPGGIIECLWKGTLSVNDSLSKVSRDWLRLDVTLLLLPMLVFLPTFLGRDWYLPPVGVAEALRR